MAMYRQRTLALTIIGAALFVAAGCAQEDAPTTVRAAAPETESVASLQDQTDQDGANAFGRPEAVSHDPSDLEIISDAFAEQYRTFQSSPADQPLAEAEASRDDAIASALVEVGNPPDEFQVSATLGTYHHAPPAFNGGPETVSPVDGKLVWLVTIQGVDIFASGGGQFGEEDAEPEVNHELNVIVDASTGEFIESLTFR